MSKIKYKKAEEIKQFVVVMRMPPDELWYEHSKHLSELEASICANNLRKSCGASYMFDFFHEDQLEAI